MLTLTRSCCNSLTPSYLGTQYSSRFFNNLKDTQRLKSKRFRRLMVAKYAQFWFEIVGFATYRTLDHYVYAEHLQIVIPFQMRMEY
ncbi:hypothetical protein GmHk_03G008095 [Glycine max]|nr:hypothetical protein GmHk_03G008095 [Glycine max]